MPDLKDLTGEHCLDAVDFDTESIRSWGDQYEDCNTMRFRLDGVVYCAIENPSDGYRSMMRDIIIDETTPQNTFAPAHVCGRIRTTGRYGTTDEVLELVDLETGELVLEVGTENTDDYYPCYVANFRPEAMAVKRPAGLPHKP